MGAAQSGFENLGKELDTLSDDAILRVAACFLRQRPSLKEALFTRISAPVDFEKPSERSAEEASKAQGITLVFLTHWSRPHVHCRAGPTQPWTQAPGIPIEPSDIDEFPAKNGDAGWFAVSFPSAAELEFVVNDGGSQWDKAPSGGNHRIAQPGLWTLNRGNLAQYCVGAGAGTGETGELASALAPPSAMPAVPRAISLDGEIGVPHELAASKGGVVLVYRTPWPRPHLHFRLSESDPWSQPPGQTMSASSLEGYPSAQGWWALHVPAARQLEFLLNDGGSNWDKAPGQKNYLIPKAGAWSVLNGALQELTAATAVPAAVVPAALSIPSSVPVPGALPAITNADVRPVKATLVDLLKLDGVVLLYRTAWPTPHLHCRINSSSTWTAMPGLTLSSADPVICQEFESDFDGKLFAMHLPKAPTLEFVVNDGGPHFRWDKAAGGANFSIQSSGVWLAFAGRMEKVQPPPVAPTGLSCLSSTRSSVTLNWSPAICAIRGYRLFRDGKLVKTLAGGAMQFCDAGLAAARTYTYALAALSPQGAQGALCSAVEAKTGEAGSPSVPMGLRVASASGKGITLEWAEPSDNGGAPVTAYAITRNGKAVATKLMGQDHTGKITWTDSDVKQGSAYSYKISACHLPPKGSIRDKVLKELKPEDQEVLSKLNEEANASPNTEPVETEAVDEMEVQACSKDLREQLKSRGITIFYKSPWSRVFTHCCARPELGWTSSPGLALTPSSTLAFPPDDGWHSIFFPYAKSMEFVMNDGSSQWDKAPGQQNYKVAMSGVLRLANGHMDRVASPPQAPTALAGEAIDGSRVRLTWKAPPVAEGEAPVACYKIFRNGCQVCVTEAGAACTFIDSNLFAFTDYEYSVAAVNNQEVAGPLSASTTVKTDIPGPPSEPRNVRATVKKAKETLSVLLEWEPPADCGGAPVASYEILRDGALVNVFRVPDAQLRGEAQECKPMAPEATSEGRRWLRHSSSYSSLSWFKDALEWEDVDTEMGQSYSYQVRAVQLGPDQAGELRSGGLVQRCGSRFLESIMADVAGPESSPIVVRAVPFLDPPHIGEQKTLIMFQAFDWGSCKAPSWYSVLLGMLPELRSAGVNMMWLPPPSDSVDDHAYLPRKWYVLDNKYGTAEALQRLVSAMHEQEIWPMLDVVVNHRCASLQDSAGRWLKFEEPDWEGWAVCHNSPAVPGGSGAGVTGEPAQYAPSVDHTNPKVREDVTAYIRYMMEEIGFRALRFDFVKGYAPHFQKDYVRAAGSPYAVAENWNGDANGLQEYVGQCQGSMAVYDFPLYYVLKRCVHANNFEELNAGGRLAGLTGRDPARSVTFVDNHDTYQLAIVGGAFGNNEQVLRGYALLLTHPGVPCVFHFDYARGPHVREKLLELCSIRRDAGIHATSQLNICAATYGLYAAIIGGKVAVKIGTNDWSPGGGWKFACAGHEFAVWIKA